MYHSRRLVLKKLGAFLASASLCPTVLNAASEPAALRPEAFSAFVDTLLPEDTVSPSATQVGVTQDLLELAVEGGQYRKLITLGCGWLDLTAGGTFDTLSESDQINVVQWMSTADWNQIPRRFYHLTRQAAIELYYSGTYATIGLPLNVAPQPDGYLPPWA